jgi:PAS domain S-box-containing protein
MAAPAAKESAPPTSDLGWAIRTVREIVERKLRTYRAPGPQEVLADLGRIQALELGIEELNVLWEELEGQSEALARERLRYAALFHHAPDAYLVTDADGKISEANLAAAELLRVGDGELVDKLLVRFVPLGERPGFRTLLRQAAAQTGNRSGWRASLLCADGSPINVELSVGGIAHPSTWTLSLCWLLRRVD